ncbi:hypothetical protein LTR66_002156 [Elasticomyces elasticus]|nr:hypothetical protein LTR66_002156 [Elasticomyces elasticus]
MHDKEDVSYNEFGIETQDDNGTHLDRTATVDVDNYSGFHARTVLVYLSLNLILAGQLLNLVGSGALARDMATAIGGSNNVIWLSTIIGIVTCVLGPPISQAADYWGRKWFLVVFTIFGFIGCMIVSRATSMNMAIAGQVVGGLSFGCQPLQFAVASEILPRRWRPEAQAGLNVVAGIAAILGLLVGLKITATDPEGFRTYFYITAGCYGIAAIICALLYNPPLRPLQVSLSQREKLNQLDWVGYGLFASGTVVFIIALSWAQNPYLWSDVHILAPLIIGGALLLAFVLYEWKVRSDGMIHHDLFKKDRNFAIALFSLFVEGTVYFAANSFFVFEVSVLYETNVFMAGVRFTITFITIAIAAALIALYCSATRKLRVPTTLAFVSFVIFHILMATATLSSGKAMWVYPVFLGIGLGVCLTTLVTAAQLSAPPALIGLLISVRSFGGSIGLAIYNSILNSQLSSKLGPNIAAAVVPLGLSPTDLPTFIGALASNNPALLMRIPGITPQIIGAGVGALKTSYLESFRYVWVAAAAMSVIAVISASFLINPTKDLNMHVDAPLEKEKD